MPTLRRVLFCLAVLGASWLLMQGIHELGHVLAAWATGARVTRIVLHPLAISRTDVALNARPLIVAWSGPIAGCIVPLVILQISRSLAPRTAGVTQFFAGFCLIANGAYLSAGVWDRVGDCGDLLRHGASQILVFCVGLIGVIAGLWLWRRLRVSWKSDARRQPGYILSWSVIAATYALLGAILLLEVSFSPRD